MVRPIRRYSPIALCTTWLLTLPATPGLASGFQLREQSPSAQGSAFAGVTAGGPDVGGMFFNPASAGLFQGNQAVLALSRVGPQTRLGGASGHRAAFLGGSAVSGPDTEGNAARPALLPALSVLWSATPDLKLGLSINVPFGMATDYDADFPGRYHGLKSDLSVLDIAPTLAWRPAPRWSLGIALVIRKADAELTNAVDFGAIVLANSAIPGALKTGVVPGGLDGTAALKGDARGYGYRLGLVFEPTERLRVGLAYHSAMDLRLRGDASFALPGGISPALAGALRAGGFRGGAAGAELALPDTASFGIHAEVTPRLSLQGEIARTGWSSFRELRVKFDTGLPPSVTEEKWRDSWFFALGLTWKPTEDWTVRTGIAYDQCPVPDATRTPRIPDGNRTWLSAGLGYSFSPSVSADLSCTRIFVTDGRLALEAVPDGSTPSGSPNAFRGDLSGTYRTRIVLVSAQVRVSF